ncbi:MAG: hypothetical protein JNK45_06295 [Myxococcales bacterium]|nr:hypothetical protein [Myxococcales bacterium]
MDDELGRDDDVGTNDGMRPGGAQEVTTPEIRVSTVSCLDHGLECVLCEPQAGTLRIREPFVVRIVNARLCVGDRPTVTWAIGRASGELAAGTTQIHTMAAEEETLRLYYSECVLLDGVPDGHAQASMPPRVTINLIKSRNR